MPKHPLLTAHAVLAAVAVSPSMLYAQTSPGGQWSQNYTFDVPATPELRGFGQVATETRSLQSGRNRVSLQIFNCENQEKASVVAGKFLADVQLSPQISSLQIPVGKTRVPALRTASGTVFVVFVDGARAEIVSAPSLADATAYLASRDDLGSAVAKAPYPTYLDRFDRYGWGFYGLDGYRNTHDWMGLAAKFDNKPGLKDPKEDFDWLVKLNNRFDAHLDPASSMGNADGIIQNSDDDWQVKLSREVGLPITFRLYGSVNSNYHGWLLRRFGEYQNRPADFLTPRVGSYAVEMMQSWYAPDAHRYQAVKAMDMVSKYVNEPHVMGWMHPYGEIQVGTWEYDHGDYGPYAQASWHQFLQKKGNDLAQVSKLYERKADFGDWNQVPIPEFATFAGLDGQVLSLGGQWWERNEVPVDQKIDDAWWKKPAEERYQGLREKWWQGDVDPAQWQQITAPGGSGLLTPSSITSTRWFRRSFSLTTDQTNKGPLYLYWFPISQEMVHSGANKRFHEVYINGSKVGEIGTWGALDVSKFVRAGGNQISLHLYGHLWQGRIFLSSETPRVFPNLGEAKDRLFVLWRQWLVDTPAADMATVFDGMRQVDPNRPIKIMAPISLGPSRYTKLAHDYGAFAHFTGEGMWYFPWYKRYSYLYDVPGSSETAGPAAPDDPTCSNQYDNFRRVFMAGLNAHDPVFMAQTYNRSPYLRAWWEKHQPVLHQLGRYDLFGPQVLLFRGELRDTGMVPNNPYPLTGAARETQNIWNWDLGRGTLQSLGQSYLYLNEQSLADGKMNGYKVMIDGGNEIMTEEARKDIGAWVQNGGTFVALPFTGRSSLVQADSWHIRALTGCEIGKFRTPGSGTVTIKANQSVFKANAGKTFPDNGSSMDWVGNELNKYSVELKPGPDSEVLATYEDGTPAVVRHRLGKGSVITFGSVFWRGSHDVKGIWWPKPVETQVIGDLLNGLGQTSLCETDGNLVWPQPYRSNNGLDWVTVLTSWNEDKDVNSKLRLHLPARPTALVSFGVDGEKQLPFTWKDGIAEATVNMPAREVKVVRALGVVQPADAVGYWWGYQQRMWHALVKPTIDFTPYRQGKFEDPTLDLRQNARFSTQKPADDRWMKPGFDDKTWTQSPLSDFRFWGAEPGKPLWVRKSFSVPEAWWKRAGEIHIVMSGLDLRNADTVQVALNGVPLDQLGGANSAEFDARKFLLKEENVLTFEFAGKTPIQAVQGQTFLYFRAEPLKSVPLTTGEQDVFIPASWENKYRVTLYMEGNRYSISSAEINDHSLKRGQPFPAPAEYNLSAYLKYGVNNRIKISAGDKPGDIQTVRLDLFPLEQ